MAQAAEGVRPTCGIQLRPAHDRRSVAVSAAIRNEMRRLDPGLPLEIFARWNSCKPLSCAATVQSVTARFVLGAGVVAGSSRDLRRNGFTASRSAHMRLVCEWLWRHKGMTC